MLQIHFGGGEGEEKSPGAHFQSCVNFNHFFAL